MANTVVNLGQMEGFQIDSKVKNLKPAQDLMNGSHVVINSATPLVTNEIDYFNVNAPADVANEVVMVMVSPENVEIGGYRIGIDGEDGIASFINKANKAATEYILGVGDDYVMSIEGFSSTPTVGQYAIPVNGSFKLAPASSPTGARLVYKVTKADPIRIGRKRIDAYRLLVVKN